MPRSRIAAAVWLTGLGVVGVQALALAARYFQPWLSADYLYAQVFAEDFLAGRYPLAGWTLCSAPSFFPDILVAVGMGALGGGAPVLPAYLVFFYLTLAILAGWSLQRATGAGWPAWLGGVALANVLLLWQPVADHAHYLWLLGTACFHGGAVLLGLANFALWAGTGEAGPARTRFFVALGVIFLGTLSDTLFLTQAALPLGVGLLAQAGWSWRHPRVRAYAQALLVAVGLVVGLRLTLGLSGWFNFSKVVRYAPTPGAVGRATADFGHDVLATLIPGAWGLLAMGLVALGLVAIGWWREYRGQRALEPALKLAAGFGLVGLAATIVLPLVTAYWRDANHIRYMLPLLVFPGWLALAWMLTKAGRWAEQGWVLAGLVVLWAGLAAGALPQIRPAALTWPYPGPQAQLDGFLVRRGLRHGLGDYWHAQEINRLSRTPVRLFALRPQANVSFWNNNAFWFYESGPQGLSVPDYDFIITDGLDEAALRRRFGEPTGQEKAGGLTIWLYSGSTGRSLTRQVDAEVREFLRGRPGAGRIAPGP